jgi:hypothetical protein
MDVKWSKSQIKVFVEHNLGFEAEHHERALRHLPGWFSPGVFPPITKIRV